MGRYWRTLRRFWGTAVAVQLEYQANVLIELLAVAMSLSGSLFLLSLFYGPDQTHHHRQQLDQHVGLILQLHGHGRAPEATQGSPVTHHQAPMAL